MKLQELIKNNFQQKGTQPERAKELSEQAFAEFEKLGLPTTKHEEWRYTNLKKIDEKDFQINVRSESVNTFFESLPIKNIAANKLVFVNGNFSIELSDIIEKDKSIIISNIFSAREKHEELFYKHFGKYSKSAVARSASVCIPR